jgi:hypothetical protein
MRTALGDSGATIYVTRFDGIRVPATDDHPIWLDSLAEAIPNNRYLHPHAL